MCERNRVEILSRELAFLYAIASGETFKSAKALVELDRLTHIKDATRLIKLLDAHKMND